MKKHRESQWAVTSYQTTLPIKRRLEHCRADSTGNSVCHTARPTENCCCDILKQSNELLRRRLNTAEESIVYVTEKLREREKELNGMKSNDGVKDRLIAELTERVKTLQKKYRSAKTTLSDLKHHSQSQSQTQTHNSSITSCSKKEKHTDLELICQRYWQELREEQQHSRNLQLQLSNALQENKQLSGMFESAKQEVERLGRVIVTTNARLRELQIGQGRGSPQKKANKEANGLRDVEGGFSRQQQKYWPVTILRNRRSKQETPITMDQPDSRSLTQSPEYLSDSQTPPQTPESTSIKAFCRQILNSNSSRNSD